MIRGSIDKRRIDVANRANKREFVEDGPEKPKGPEKSLRQEGDSQETRQAEDPQEEGCQKGCKKAGLAPRVEDAPCGGSNERRKNANASAPFESPGISANGGAVVIYLVLVMRKLVTDAF